MRAVRISIILFLVIGAVTVVGVVMNHCVCEKMQQHLDALPSRADAAGEREFVALEGYWQEQRGWLRFTSNAALWRVTNDLVGDVCLYGRARSQGEYDAARRRLASAIQEMSRPGWTAH